MYKFLPFLILILLPLTILAEEEKPEFTEDQLDRLQAAEEKYKDSPEIMNLIGRLKDQYGLNEDTPGKQPPPEPVKQEPSLQGDPNIAETAYKKRDYATAIEHYKALAAEGDAEASLKLGTMYEMGKGTDKDSAAAHAWYKKAAEEGDDRAKMFLKSIEKTAMSEDDLTRAEEQYRQISEEPGDESEAGEKEPAQTGVDYRFSLLPGVIQGQWHDPGYTKPREAKISLEKFSPAHQKPVLSGEHIQLHKFNRESSVEITTDS